VSCDAVVLCHLLSLPSGSSVIAADKRQCMRMIGTVQAQSDKAHTI
jgi:hypothetical protein